MLASLCALTVDSPRCERLRWLVCSFRQGRIADEYGALLKELWGGKYRVVLPSKFKQVSPLACLLAMIRCARSRITHVFSHQVLGEFAPRFSGYNQQDSSELLSFLLDGLHEVGGVLHSGSRRMHRSS